VKFPSEFVKIGKKSKREKRKTKETKKQRNKEVFLGD